MLILSSCSKKETVVTASNERYNTLYKGQARLLPIGNVIVEKQDQELLQKNYEYYAKSYEIEKNKYDANQKHMLFLVKNDKINRIKNVMVETIPPANKEYLIAVAQMPNYRDINREPYLEIEYSMFINDAKLAKKFRESNGDPIIHPYVYQDVAMDKRRVVIGDEYYSWKNACDVDDEAC